MGRRRGGRKRAMGTRAPMLMPVAPNRRRSLDFVSDRLTDCRRLRALTVKAPGVIHPPASPFAMSGYAEPDPGAECRECHSRPASASATPQLSTCRKSRTLSTAAENRRLKATDFTREVFEFYALDESCLWITFGEGSLWWAFAKEGVVETGAGPGHGERHRVLMTPWCNTDINGTVLSIANLSTRLTKVAAYRQTLCRVEAEAYLIRKINGVEEPLVAEAKLVQTAVIDVAERLVAQLHWRDFEVLCDLIFARSGWQRIAELGGLQEDTDLVLEQIASGERAFVQVKSEAGQQTLNDYIARFEADPSFDRMFFACHSPRTKLEISGSKPVHVWTGEKLARQAVAAGLLDWLVEKAG
jgi:hypothetical protein